MTNKVTEVQIIPIKARDGLIGFANLVINQSLFLGSIGIHTKRNGNGYRLTYPTKKIGDREINLYHPINHELSEIIEEAVFSKLEEIYI